MYLSSVVLDLSVGPPPSWLLLGAFLQSPFVCLLSLVSGPHAFLFCGLNKVFRMKVCECACLHCLEDKRQNRDRHLLVKRNSFLHRNYSLDGATSQISYNELTACAP